MPLPNLCLKTENLDSILLGAYGRNSFIFKNNNGKFPKRLNPN